MRSDRSGRDQVASEGEEELATTLHFDEQELVCMEPPAIGRGGAFLFSFLGLGLAAGGAALAASPWYSWQAQQVAERLAGAGFSAGTAIAAGVMLFAVGRVGRALAKLAARPPLIEPRIVHSISKVADHVSLLAGTVADLQEQVTHLGLREPIVNVAAPPPDADLMQLYRDQRDAVFRLAASLDKVGRGMSEQVTAGVGGLDKQLESMRGELRSARAALDKALERAAQANGAARSARPEAAPAAALPRQQPKRAEPRPPRDEVVLEEPHPGLETEVSPLSFLDGLKDIAPPSQNPRAKGVEAPPLDFDLLDQVDAPLPGTPQDQRARQRRS